MEINVLAKYTVNGSDEQSKELTLTIKESWLETKAGEYAIMSMAADALIEEGQIMISSVEVLTPAAA